MTPRHGRFYLAFGAGLLVVLLAWVQAFPLALGLLAGVNSFFLIYLVLMARLIRSHDAEGLRRHAGQDDEGVAVILVLALLAVVASLTAIVLVVNDAGSSPGARVAAFLCLPLGWTTIHVLAAFHYAHLHYQGSRVAMIFPATTEPGIWDFLYASFTIGMTAQVSDVEVMTTAVRRAVLLHAVASFFYNTGILALAVNAAVGIGW